MTTDNLTPLDPADADRLANAYPQPNRAKPARVRRMVRAVDDCASNDVDSNKRQFPGSPSKLDQIAALLAGPDGASIAEIMAATGWQAHSVRGAMAGALKKRGLAIVSERIAGVRRYRACSAA